MGFIYNCFSSKPKSFATELAEKISRQFPPASEKQLVKRGSQRRLEGVLDIAMRDIDEFQHENSLNWIGKARFGTAFKWALLDKGYTKQFAEAITEGVIRHLVPK